MIENQNYILKIITVAQYLESYWFLDQSESNNGEVKVCAPLNARSAGDFFRKRVYDYERCYEELLKHFAEQLKGFDVQYED